MQPQKQSSHLIRTQQSEMPPPRRSDQSIRSQQSKKRQQQQSNLSIRTNQSDTPSRKYNFRNLKSPSSSDSKPRPQEQRDKDEAKRNKKDLPESLKVNVLKDYNTVTLHAIYGGSLVLMMISLGCFIYYRFTIDLHPHYGIDYSLTFAIFYITGNSLVIFRLLGVRFLTQVAHVLMHAIVISLLILRYFDEHTLEFQFLQYTVIAVYSLQFIFSFPLVCFMPSTIQYYNPTNIWLHVHTGVLTFFVVSWNFMLQMSMLCGCLRHEISSLEFSSMPSVIMVVSTLYVLCILFMLLMPTFNFTIRNTLDNSVNDNRQSILGTRHMLSEPL